MANDQSRQAFVYVNSPENGRHYQSGMVLHSLGRPGRAASHSALSTDEILSMIFDDLADWDIREPPDFRKSEEAQTLVAASLTCRSWVEPALQALWRDSDLETVLKMLAPIETVEEEDGWPEFRVR